LYKIIYREIAKSWYMAEDITRRRQRVLLEEKKIQLQGEKDIPVSLQAASIIRADLQQAGQTSCGEQHSSRDERK